MHLDHLLLPRDSHLAPRQSGSCVTCPAPPPCNCASGEQCFQINRDCYNCASFKCVAPSSASGSGGGGGVSKGAVAGAVIGILIFLAGVIALFLWYRRRWNARKAAETREVKADVPASAETVLSRPDPSEKPTPPPTVRVYSNQSNTTIDLDPESRGNSTAPSTPNPFNSIRSSVQSNPFEDNHSIQTTSTGTQATNVIPIALVAPNSGESLSQAADSSSGVTSPSAPQRPVRSPELNLEHVNVSRDELRGTPQPAYAASAISGISGMSRNSYMSNASYSSDFLNEAPVIVTADKGGVRQVLGVQKAEVLQAPGSNPQTPTTANSLKPSSSLSRPSVRSPLAASSFTPADTVQESSREEDERSVTRSPFGDENTSPAFSQTTFGTPSARAEENIQHEVSDNGSSIDQNIRVPWAHNDGGSTRPSSLSTQAGSIIAASVADIGSATRVNVGLRSPNTISPGPATAQSFPRSPYRTTMGRLVNPSQTSLKSPESASSGSTFEDQQRAALAHAQARAQAQGLEKGRRVSGSSVVTTSTRADSILESFPFVPPSPISNRPIRSPPRSPLTNQFAQSSTQGSEGRQSAAAPESATLPPLDPPNRKFLGLSTASQGSTTSSGLGEFPFQVEQPPSNESGGKQGAPPTSYPPSGFQGRQRASLDTLALTSDLTSYPLGFDRRPRDA